MNAEERWAKALKDRAESMREQAEELEKLTAEIEQLRIALYLMELEAEWDSFM